MTAHRTAPDPSAWSLVPALPPALDLPVRVVSPAATHTPHVSPWLQRAHAQRGGSIDELVATLQAVDTTAHRAGHKHAAEPDVAAPKRPAQGDQTQ